MLDTRKFGKSWEIGAFFTFLAVGAVYIFFTKSNEDFQQNIFVLLVVPIVCLFGYALFSYNYLINLSHEQKGDNCYYLGFLYTLVSLLMSLYNVSSGIGESTDELERGIILKSLLYGFSIAVVSTIVGIFLRVIFHQWSSSPPKNFRIETESISPDSIDSELVDTLVLISEKFAESAEFNKALTDNSIKIVASLNDINQKLTEFTTLNLRADNNLKPIVSELVEVTKNVSDQNVQLLEINRRQENLLDGAQVSLNKQTETLNAFVAENETKPLITELVEVTKNVSDQNAQILEINRKQENLLEGTQVNLNKQTETLNTFVAENETKPLMKELVSVVKDASNQNSELVKIAKDQGNHLNKISESMDKNSEAEAKIMSDSKKLLSKIDRRLDALKVNFIVFTLSRFRKILRIFRGK